MHLLNVEYNAKSLEMSGDLRSIQCCVLFCIFYIFQPTTLYSSAEVFFSVMSFFSFCRTLEFYLFHRSWFIVKNKCLPLKKPPTFCAVLGEKKGKVSCKENNDFGCHEVGMI